MPLVFISTVCFGGSANSLNALKLGFRLSQVSGLPLEENAIRADNAFIHYLNLHRDRIHTCATAIRAAVGLPEQLAT